MNEIVFRLLMLVLIMSLVAIRLYFILSNKRVILQTNRNKDVEPKSRSTVMNMLVLVSRIILIMYFVTPWFISSFSLGIDDRARLSAAAFAALLLCTQIWVHKTLGSSFDFRLVTRDNQRLVTGGPYKWIRNPMYSVNILTEISFGIISSNSLILVLGVITGAMILTRAYREEKMMLEHFGAKYEQYRRSTKRFIPFIY